MDHQVEVTPVRHDRYGEPIEEDDEDTEGARPHRCRRGWIDRNADHPVPCLVCKPHLARAANELTSEEASR